MTRFLQLIRATVVALFILTASQSVFALLAENGWYWNTSESGRGFNIEIQNNLLFMSGFIYDAAGNPIWVVTGGPMSSQNTYSGDVYRTSGGQCIGCPYHAPQMVYYGTARITFSDSMTASITINGVTVNVQREQFGIDLSNVATPLLGEWATTDGTSLFPVYFAERITFPRAQVLNNVVTATGSMTGAASRLAVGGFVSGRWGILLDSSTSYYDLYTFTFCGFNRIEGSDYTYPKGSSPSGSMPFFAHRIKSAAAAAGLDAPGTGKRLQMQSAAALWHVEDVAVSKVGMAGGERAATPDEVLQIQQMARVLEQALEAAQVSTQ